jgi:putative SOS response-associated peptidase YedK
MCGRVRLSSEFSQIRIRLKLDDIFAPPNFPPRWNLPPTENMLCVVKDPERGTRRAGLMRWGLLPHYAKDAKLAYSTFNARADSVDSKPAFRDAWKRGHRCLVVTDGFYEWRKSDKQPFAICVKDDLTVMAGLWSVWRSPASEKIPTCTIITTDANEGVAPLHDRMPVILEERHWPAWLGETPASDDDLHAMLKPLPPDQMEVWPVNRRVGNVKNEGPHLAIPITLAEP